MCEGEIGVGWVFLRPPPVSLFIKVTPRKIDPLVRWMEEEEESSKVRLEEIGRDSPLNLLLILGRKSGGDFNACQNPFFKKQVLRITYLLNDGESSVKDLIQVFQIRLLLLLLPPASSFVTVSG